MKSYRIIHQFLFVLAFLPLVLGWGPWYLMTLLPLALIIPYGINEVVIDKRSGRNRTPESADALHRDVLEQSERLG
ncbi:hypothetical protein [Arthrobacter sp. Helios]|uniref:hypothetical protein n=1 Tax=Arthrobacter sp. Helios TaxID=2828862 RepID=UPI00206D388A|nr:hypothetical protein [Arthrobacter sp. Helios]UPO76383.1 hypothetical protein ArtHe_13650 [Arthrobacter sp. Helios]